MNIDAIFLNLIFFLVVFFLVFLVDFYFITKSKDKDKKRRIEKLTSEGSYLISRFNLDERLISLRMLNFRISIINSFIIAFVSTVISVVNVGITIQLLIAFVLLFALIYSLYEIYGRHLKKKYGKINKKEE